MKNTQHDLHYSANFSRRWWHHVYDILTWLKKRTPHKRVQNCYLKMVHFFNAWRNGHELYLSLKKKKKFLSLFALNVQWITFWRHYVIFTSHAMCWTAVYISKWKIADKKHNNSVINCSNTCPLIRGVRKHF